MEKTIKILAIGLLSLLLVVSVSAMSVDYFYHPDCGHCQKIAPFINEQLTKHKEVVWDIVDTSRVSTTVTGTPFLRILTNDNREITYSGSYEIPKFLECEINEQSTLDCPTYSYLNCSTNSYFIR